MSVTVTSTSVSSEILKFYVIGQRWLVGIGNVREVSVEIFQLRVGCIFMTKAFWKYFLSFLKINFNGKFWGEKRVQPVETKWRPKNMAAVSVVYFLMMNRIKGFVVCIISFQPPENGRSALTGGKQHIPIPTTPSFNGFIPWVAAG